MAMFRPMCRGISALRYGSCPISRLALSASQPIASTTLRGFSSTPEETNLERHEDFSIAPVEQSLERVKSEDFSKMSNEELADTSTIPGWDLIHSPPRKFPRGALVGTVVSTRMTKTVNVAVDRYRIVPKIRKRVRYTRKFFAHDENEVANKGDLVMITPSHRISKHKHFMLREIIRPKGQL